MKPLPAKPSLLLCLVALLLTGCPGKKPPAISAPPPPAPSAASQPEQPPVEAPPQTQTAQAPTQGTPPSDQKQDQPAAEPAENRKAKTGKLHAAKKAASQPVSGNTRPVTETARNVPPKVTVKSDAPEPGSIPGQISPSLPQNEAARDQTTTEQLLQSTETSLRGIKRQLSPDEEAMVTQIKDYMTQSRVATKENDLVRAHNLATKAHLLSDELAKRQ